MASIELPFNIHNFTILESEKNKNEIIKLKYKTARINMTKRKKMAKSMKFAKKKM